MRRPLITLAIACAVGVAPATAEARERLVRQVGRDHGLPVTLTNAVHQDGDGFLWFGTAGGLYRWDGVRAVRWAPETLTGMILWMASTPDRAVYAAEWEGPLFQLDPDEPERATPLIGPEGEPIVEVLHLRADPRGGLWVASRSGLLHRDAAGEWTRPHGGTIEGHRVLRLGVLRDGTVIASTWYAAYRLGGDAPQPFLDIEKITGIEQTTGDILWIATDGAELWEVDLSGAAPAKILRGRWPERAWDLAVRGDEAWMLMGGRTVTAVPGGIPEVVNDDDRIPPANRVFVDREGSVWFGANRGIYQLTEPATATWSIRDGIQFGATRFLGRNAAGLWVSTWGAGWSRIDDVVRDGMRGREVSHGPVPELRGPLCTDERGDVWTGSGGKLWLHRGGEWIAQDLADGDDYTNCFVLPGRGMLISSWQGLHLSEDGAPPRPLPSPLDAMQPDGSVRQLLLDRSGMLWASSHAEVCRAKFADVLAGAPGWRCDPVDHAGDILQIVETPSGAIWIATHLRGVLRFVDGTWTEVESSRSLPSRLVHAIVRARDGETIWLAGPGYLRRVREERGGEAWTAVEDLGELHGIAQIGGGDILEDDDGTLWVATAIGVLEIPARVRTRPPALDKVVLVEARLDGRTPRGAGRWWLDSGDNHIELTFSALSFREPQRVRYRARVDGGMWSVPSPSAVLQLVDLAPGEHRVDVEATIDGVTWAGLGAPILLGVPRPWWQRPWLWSLAVVMLIVVIVAVQRARYAVRLRLVQQRVRIAMDLHDEIGSGLGSIGILAGMASSGRVPPERGAELTGKVAHTAQRLGQSLTDIVASLREGGDRLDALFDYLAERGGALMPDESPRLEMRPPTTWPTETMSLAARRTVQLIALEAMHNAVRHAEATRVEVGAAVDGRRWRLWIEDDGIGVAAGAPPRPGGGQGQGVMRRRAEAIRAELRIGPGTGDRGTRVEIVFEPDAKERTA